MHWVAPGRCLIAWDAGQGPHFARGAGGAYLKRKPFESYDVYRTAGAADLTGVLIGTTRAEAFLDFDAPEGLVVFYRVVGRTKGGGTLPVGARITAVIPRRLFASADTTPPSEPDHFKVYLRDGGNLLRWSAACDAESGLLAYLVYDSNQDQPDSVVWANDDVRDGSRFVRQFLDRTTEAKKRYQLRPIDCALNLSADGPVNYASANGWTVYTFSASSRFTVKAKEEIKADVLCVGGGGSGGAGNDNGAGGAGGGVFHQHGVWLVPGETDGDVTVGLGGAEVDCAWAEANLMGHSGEDTVFGGFTAQGSGYGAGQADYEFTFLYGGADGASGGGGDPWSAGIVPGQEGEYVPQYHGYGGHASADAYEDNTHVPYGDGTGFYDAARASGYVGGVATGFWVDPADGLRYWTVRREQGEDGGDGDGYKSWYNITAGGGGGAHDPYLRDADGELVMTGGHTWPYFTYDQFGEMQSTQPKHGKHGVPCDIKGWSMYEETAHVFKFIDWYGGGGAGVERKVWWSYFGGKPGYGGGGAANTEGADGTGGGGGGGTTGADWPYPYNTPGPKGGDGVVIIRIRTCDEDLVTYPLITGEDPDPEHNEFGLPICLCDDAAVTIRRLPEYMTHDDCSGDEQCPRTYEETH